MLSFDGDYFLTSYDFGGFEAAPAGKDDLLLEAAKDFLLVALLLVKVLFDLPWASDGALSLAGCSILLCSWECSSSPSD